LSVVAFTETFPVVTTREVANLPIVASELLVSVIVDSAWFTETNPPVLFVDRALAFVVVALVIVSAAALIDGLSA